METLVSLVILFLLFFTFKSGEADRNGDVYEEVRVGLVLDLSSIQGKILEDSFSLALTDFYGINHGYKTRVSLSIRDSQGDPLLALASVKDLVTRTKVEAIVGAQSLQEAKLLAAIGAEKAEIPLISLLTPSSSTLTNKYDNFIQRTYDTASEAKGITTFLHKFDWKSIVFIYKDVEDWREGLQVLVEHFQDDGIQIVRFVSFTESSGEDYMKNWIRKLKAAKTTVFMVHMSEILVSRLFRCVETLGMMEEGYAWILTVRTMNHFHYSDDSEFSSMQGVVGFRSYIPESEKVKNFTWRLKKSMVNQMETKHFSVVISVWAHDIASILAIAAEKTSLRGRNVADLLETIRQNRFKGLSGDIEMIGNRFQSNKFEIVNFVGTGERRIGLWSHGSFRSRRRHNYKASSINEELETIIWAGGYSRIPGHHRSLAKNDEKKLLRVLVTSRNRFPNLLVVRRDPETGLNTVTGFCIEVFMAAMSHFNYKMEFISFDDNSYDNLAYKIFTQKDEYDAAIGDITITANRSLYVDFTLPFTDIGIGVLTLKRKRKSMWTFFEPFEKSLWLASGAFFILTGIVVWLIEKPVNPEFQGSWIQQLGMILWFGFSTLVFAHREKLENMSSRFLVLVWVFVVLILTASYSANLTSTKTISRIQLAQFVISSARFKSSRTYVWNTIENNAEALLNGTAKFIVDEIPYLSILQGTYPDLFVITEREDISNGFGFMFQKGSGLALNVSTEIAKLRESGKLKDMEKRWFQRLDSFTLQTNSVNENDDDATKRLTITELGGLFIIVGVAYALVLALYLVQIRRNILHLVLESRLFTKLFKLLSEE